MIRITGLHIPGLQQRPVAVMGAFRCGTNYLSYLLAENYRCRMVPDAYGWKHMGVPIHTLFHGRQLNLTPIAVVAKDPFAFLTSLERYYAKVGRNIDAPKDWEDFVAQPIVLFDSGRKKSPQMKFANPVQYWNWLYWNLANLPAGRYRSAVVSYPDLLADPEGRTERIAQDFGLRRRAGAFRLPTEQLKRNSTVRLGRIATESVPADETVSPPKADGERTGGETAGGETDYMTAFSGSQIDFVRRQADPVLIERFGFNKLEVFR